MGATTKERIARIAREMLSGTMDLFVGCREICALRGSGLSETDEQVLTTIIGVESETDAFPIGSERSLWDADALREKDEELSQYLHKVRPIILAACRRIIEQFELPA
jgi:hypothetical protein